MTEGWAEEAGGVDEFFHQGGDGDDLAGPEGEDLAGIACGGDDVLSR
ncbi:hypothetical protein [Streptomyces sp. NPDC048252]